jgi:alpha-beta hydrolase superfamily lysophospholipase
MGLITEHGGATDGYEAVELPSDSVRAAELTGAFIRRLSARPTRRAVLYLHCAGDRFVQGDLVRWYTERGFHFYAADMRPPGGPHRPAKLPGGRVLQAYFAELDAACGYLRDVEGIDMLIVSAHAAGAVTAALWCDARKDDRPADALILSSPALGRHQRRPLAIACPVLVLVGPGEPGGGRRNQPRVLSRRDRGTPPLGVHVTWLRLDGPTGDAAPGPADRRRFFDEMGRWLGAYMYGHVRDQLL